MSNYLKHKELLDKIIFLEIKDINSLNNIFHKDFNLHLIYHGNQEVFLPIESKHITNSVEKLGKIDSIPFSRFFEGMFLCLALSEDLKYNLLYKTIILNSKDGLNYLKYKIAESLNKEDLENAFIFLKALLTMEKNKDTLEKIIYICHSLKNKDKYYEDEELDYIDELIKIEDYPLPYIYKANVFYENNDLDKALIHLNLYIEKGGEVNQEILDHKESIISQRNLIKGKEILYEKPEEAIKLLIPLLDYYLEDPLIYYYLAVAYRLLDNYEKAIYYLNEALSLQGDYVEVINELGLNYSCLGDFNTALKYFIKAFEAVQDISICTNIIMCYIEVKEIDKAKEYIKKGKKLKGEDDILIKLEKMLMEGK